MPKDKHQPERKIGPLAGGLGVAIWLNTVDTKDGPRKVRSVSISPRRYRDPESGEWKDAPSYRPGDLPALIYALTKAQDYIFSTPIPGDEDAAGESPPF